MSGFSAAPERGPAILDDVVAVHLEAFPGFFMAQLGPRFLREYYRCVEEYPQGILLAEMNEQGCVGFVAGFINPSEFYRNLRNRRIRLALAAGAGIAARPQRLITMFANYRRAGHTARQVPAPDTAELSSLAVLPSAAGHGAGTRLVQRFIAAAKTMGAAQVALTTDTNGNDAVNRFYRKLGFACVRTFKARRGRLLNEYVLEIGKARSCANPS